MSTHTDDSSIVQTTVASSKKNNEEIAGMDQSTMQKVAIAKTSPRGGRFLGTWIATKACEHPKIQSKRTSCFIFCPPSGAQQAEITEQRGALRVYPTPSSRLDGEDKLSDPSVTFLIRLFPPQLLFMLTTSDDF